MKIYAEYFTRMSKIFLLKEKVPYGVKVAQESLKLLDLERYQMGLPINIL